MNPFFRLPYNRFTGYTACKVKHGHCRVHFLLRKTVAFAVQIYKPHGILQIPEAGFDPPTQMVRFPDTLQGKRIWKSVKQKTALFYRDFSFS